MLSIIKAIFAFFQMQIESLLRDIIEFLQSPFRRRPKTFYPVDMIRADGKLIIRVRHAKMFRVTDINHPVIAAPAVRMNDRFSSDMTANNRLQSSGFTVWHNLGIDRPVAFENTKDDCFTRCAAPGFSAHRAAA